MFVVAVKLSVYGQWHGHGTDLISTVPYHRQEFGTVQGVLPPRVDDGSKKLVKDHSFLGEHIAGLPCAQNNVCGPS